VPERYEGPWQISHATDLDPTVLLRGDEPPEGTPAARLRKLRLAQEQQDAWWLASYRHAIGASGDDAYWLTDTSDVPQPSALLTARAGSYAAA